MHSLILGPLLTDISWFCLMSSIALSTIRLIFWIGLNKLRLSVVYFLVYFFSYFLIIISCTGFSGSRYFSVSLYSLFSTSLSKFCIISSLTLPPYFLYGQSSTSFASADWKHPAVYCMACEIDAKCLWVLPGLRQGIDDGLPSPGHSPISSEIQSYWWYFCAIWWAGFHFQGFSLRFRSFSSINIIATDNLNHPIIRLLRHKWEKRMQDQGKNIRKTSFSWSFKYLFLFISWLPKRMFLFVRYLSL